MVRKHYVLALVSFLLIPAVVVFGGMLSNFINPEIAAGHPDYERNYRLLELAKHVFVLAAASAVVGLWLLTCSFLLKSKDRSPGWLVLAALGPFGLILLTMLGSRAPGRWDSYQRFVGKLKLPLRAAYELCLFVAVWVIAYQTMVLKRELLILREAAARGVSTAQIVDEQNASSGMWAFGEGLEVLYLVALFYLLWPVCFDAASRLPRYWASSQRA